MTNPNALNYHPQENKEDSEKVMELIADSLVVSDIEGNERQPFYEAFDYLMKLRETGINGGCAESSAIFLFGEQLLKNLNLLPENPINEEQSLIRYAELLYNNLFEIAATQNTYHNTERISPKRADLVTNTLSKPYINQFLAVTTGDFYDDTIGQTVPIGHMIAGISNSLNTIELPDHLNRFKNNPTMPCYWVWDSSDFGRRVSPQEKVDLAANVLSFPPGLRLMSPRLVSKLLCGYSNGSPIVIKPF